MEGVLRALCEEGIQVSVSALPSSIAGSSATPPVVLHHQDASAHTTRPPQAASPKGGGECKQCPYSFLAPIAAPPTPVRGERGALFTVVFTPCAAHFSLKSWINSKQMNI